MKNSCIVAHAARIARFLIVMPLYYKEDTKFVSRLRRQLQTILSLFAGDELSFLKS
jgi:hypothetical protein